MNATLIGIGANFVHANLGVRALATACADWPITVLETNINLPFDRILRDVLRCDFDFVGISVYIWNREIALRLARALRAARPYVYVLLGGPEAGYDAERVLCESRADAVVRGEGEAALRQLLERCAAGQPFRGIWEAEPVARWPYPYTEGLDANRLCYIETSRGCPFRCSYCLSSVQGRVRALPERQALEYLLRAKRDGARVVKLVDRTFNFDTERAKRIWEGLMRDERETPTGTVFHFEIRADLLDAQSLALLAAAPKGLFQLEIGVQSTRGETLDAVRRGAEFERLASALRTLRAADTLALHVDLIAGLPGESYADFAHSFDAVYALRPQRLQLGFLKLLHGSPLRTEAEALGYRYCPDAPYEVIASDCVTEAEFLRLHDVEEALEWYYNRGFYTASLRYAQLLGVEGFALYESLGDSLRASGALDRPLGEAERAKLLRDWLVAREGAHWAEEVVAYDWLCRQGTPPDWMRQARVARKNLPRGQRVERFSIDMPALAERGELREGDFEILFEGKGANK